MSEKSPLVQALSVLSDPHFDKHATEASLAIKEVAAAFKPGHVAQLRAQLRSLSADSVNS